MWPIMGPLEYNQTHQWTKSNNFQRSLFGGRSPKDRIVQSLHEINSKNNPTTPVIIISNIRYIDPISSTCLIVYSLILLLLCALPILALDFYLRQAFATFHQTSQLQIHDQY